MTVCLLRPTAKKKVSIVCKLPFIFKSSNNSQPLMIDLSTIFAILGFHSKKRLFNNIVRMLEIQQTCRSFEKNIVRQLLDACFDEDILGSTEEVLFERLKKEAYFDDHKSAHEYLKHIFKAEFLPNCGTEHTERVNYKKMIGLSTMVAEILKLHLGWTQVSNRDYIGE